MFHAPKGLDEEHSALRQGPSISRSAPGWQVAHPSWLARETTPASSAALSASARPASS